MATTFNVFLRERGNESNLFDIGPFCTTWRFQLLRRNGCGPASFTAVMTDAEWATLEATGLMVTDAVVHFYLKMNEDAAHRVWGGTLKSYPLAKNTPPDRRRRKFTCAPVWSQLKKPGCLLLRAFDDDETVQAIMKELVNGTDPDHTCMSDHTDVSANTIDITTGTDFSPGRTLFIDQDAESCVKKCAEVYGDVVYGVTGNDDHLYFAAETNSTADPVATFRMGTHADGVVKFTRKTHVQRKQYNHVVVKGREAKAGNPMSMEYEDPALATDPSMIRRSHTVNAPENVKGETLLRWAEFLVAQNKDPKETALLAVAGIDTKFVAEGDILRTWQQVNGNIAVEDEDGGALGQWPIQGITYSMASSGAFGGKFELGDDLQQDLVGALKLRDTLRELAVYDIKEFSNQVELQAMNDSWLEDAYVFFVLNHGMRNSVRVSLQSLKHIDFENAETHSLITDATDDGITGIVSEDDETVMGQFVTQQIPVGKHYDNWALLRNNTYSDMIAGHEDAGWGKFWAPKPLPPHSTGVNLPFWLRETLSIPDGSTARALMPMWFDPWDPRDVYGAFLHDNQLHPSAHIDWTMTWDEDTYGDVYGRRALIVFGYCSRNDYHFVEFWHVSDIQGNRIKWRAGKYVAGVLSYDDTLTGTMPFLAPTWQECRLNIRIEPDTANDSYTLRVRKWSYASNEWALWSTHVSTPGWYSLAEATHSVGMGQSWDAVPAEERVEGPYWTSLKYDNCVAGSNWYISRDGGASWEGPLNADTGAMVNLGTYAGGGTEKDYVLIKGFVAFPQLLTGYAIGWK